ncbi:hypothetical protein FA10DRAFT_131205 [Acaromyces ingoldii]|uniref:Uncharacterized protein n=1 Tax=Acaromyces ingoldii TaxID=215250 RepID=A0A316YHE2_9BASI|nr:hypothetical protein FA10DRAFT_131205 [Acaromyces ingoldii]PWN88847.1 hypothetical protein FA10DRAFT_131205 [Acaromyces ingoldii]
MSTNVDMLIPKTKGVLIGATVFLWINFVVQLADIGLSANLLANPYENYYDYYDGFYDTLDFSGSATAAVAVCAVNLIFVIVPAIYCTIITVQFAKFARCPSDLQARPNRAHGIALTVLAVLQLIVGIAGIGVAAT